MSLTSCTTTDAEAISLSRSSVSSALMIAEALVTANKPADQVNRRPAEIFSARGPAHNSGVQQRKVRRQRVVRQSVPVRVGERGSRFAERLCIALYEQFKTALYPGTRDVGVTTGGTVGYFAQERSGIGIVFDRPTSPRP